MSKRALRRHHYRRLLKKRIGYYGGARVWDPSTKEKGMRVNTVPVCSCTMCGNQRRHFKCKTRAEYRALLNFIDGCHESGVFCPLNAKHVKYNLEC